MKMKQDELFPPGKRSGDMVVICNGCGREIVVQSATKDGVSSEYRDAQGCCWDCSKRKK
jgi:hypothetical protein